MTPKPSPELMAALGAIAAPARDRPVGQDLARAVEHFRPAPAAPEVDITHHDVGVRIVGAEVTLTERSLIVERVLLKERIADLEREVAALRRQMDKAYDQLGDIAGDEHPDSALCVMLREVRALLDIPTPAATGGGQ